MDGKRDTIAAWVAKELLPHEQSVHVWLSRRWRGAVDPDDVIQEAYCRISNLASVHHIENPVGYFRRTVHAVAADITRRAGVINFTSTTEMEWLDVRDNEPLADRTIEANQELRRVDTLLGELGEVCREAIRLRRIEGLSQRETAQRLGISEDAVRNHLVRGVKRVLRAMADQDADASETRRERAKG